ncbi:MAG TPA: hypothetical protein PKA00_10440 [Saprospiraceae bacterium]|nr:hypothetical protein [Saprospiraceae bacterium]HMQ83318.1 hypothetical protein [Saprospiraceae bacterium]
MKQTIEKSKLVELLRIFSKREINAFRQFLLSPYFNQRTDLIQLFDCLQKYMECQEWPDKKTIWASLGTDQAYDARQLLLLMSYLTKLAEQFVAVENTLSDSFEIKMKVAEHCGKHASERQQALWLKEAGRTLEKQDSRNAEYYFRQYQIEAAAYRLAFSRSPEKEDHFANLTPSLDRAFMAMKLRQNMWLLNHDKLYKWGYQPSALDKIVEQLPLETFGSATALHLYAFGIAMLKEPENDAIFKQFKNTLVTNSKLFPMEEARDLYLLAINFGVRQVNDGRRVYFHDIMDLYKEGLEQGFLLRNGQLSRFTYHNIVATALQIGDMDWAESFLEIWTNKLERPFRERMYHFNRAKIAYARRHYDEALLLLQQSNYHDTLLNLGARTLLLKIYYELDEWDALQSHLDAFQNYLRRKADLSYHRTNYRNLIRFTRKLLQINLSDKKQCQKLSDQINQENILTEKDWLLSQLGG